MTRSQIGLKKMYKDWVAALRSGKFKQGQHALARKTPEGMEYCCLGVYAEINGMFTQEKLGRKRVFNNFFFLPHDVMDRELQQVLSKMNDKGFSFDEIADWIERKLV